ncbi:MAG: hypothetical protein QGF53_09975 [Alphaproteobacteria bacterium]|nr:hypothetical protein [Alphaproteobacteria bacterium]
MGQGYESAFVTIGDAMTYAEFESAGTGDVAVISKSFKPATLEIARGIKRAGTPLVVDLCDYRPDNRDVMYQTKALVAEADVITVSTPAVGAAVRDHWGRDTIVIEDPYEGPEGPPRFAPRTDRLSLTWFGHPTNIEALYPLLAGLLQMPRGPGSPAIDFEVVTTPIPSLIEALGALSGVGGEACSFRLTPWSPDANWQALAACDMVLLPSQDNAYFQAKGANRLIETLRAGRLPLAHPTPAYTGFSDFAWVDGDLLAGLRWALANPAEALARVTAGQAFINAHFSPEAIGAKWAEALRSLA